MGTVRWPGGSVYWARALGLSYRQVDHWCRIGRLGPRLMESRGSGSVRTFTIDEVFRLAVLAEAKSIWQGGSELPAGLSSYIATATLDDVVGVFQISSSPYSAAVINAPALAEHVRDLWAKCQLDTRHYMEVV